MTIDRIGAGTINIELSIQGLTNKNWENLQSAEVMVLEPDGGKIYIPADKVAIDKENKKLIFNVTVSKEGEHVVVAKLNFKNNKYTITYQPYRFYVSNWWEVAL